MQTFQRFVTERATLLAPDGDDNIGARTCIPLVLADCYIREDAQPHIVDAREFKRLLTQEYPRNGVALKWDDGVPKLAMEVAGFFNDQDFAYKVMGLGEFYGIWRVVRPFSHVNDQAVCRLAARAGLLGIVGWNEPRADENGFVIIEQELVEETMEVAVGGDFNGVTHDELSRAIVAGIQAYHDEYHKIGADHGTINEKAGDHIATDEVAGDHVDDEKADDGTE